MGRRCIWGRAGQAAANCSHEPPSEPLHQKALVHAAESGHHALFAVVSTNRLLFADLRPAAVPSFRPLLECFRRYDVSRSTRGALGAPGSGGRRVRGMGASGIGGADIGFGRVGSVEGLEPFGMLGKNEGLGARSSSSMTGAGDGNSWFDSSWFRRFRRPRPAISGMVSVELLTSWSTLRFLSFFFFLRGFGVGSSSPPLMGLGGPAGSCEVCTVVGGLARWDRADAG